jgi:L,D-transpeptidase ErfK/SrfK
MGKIHILFISAAMVTTTPVYALTFDLATDSGKKSRYRLPSGPREGIVLNIAERRVYYYHPDSTKVSTYPVGVGKQGWSTPLGNTTIVRKVKNPTWTPPPSIVREAARRGKILRAVKPGPKNPLGRYAMYLGMPRILMHGTTSPSSIGHRSSHGCIRMFNKDIAELFNYVSPGTPVRIVYEPKK